MRGIFPEKAAKNVSVNMPSGPPARRSGRQNLGSRIELYLDCNGV